MKKINFILPCDARNPIGGFKIIFEYANRFVKDNYKVNIILPATLLWKERTLNRKLKGILKYFYFAISKKYLPNSWFLLDKNIKIYWVPTLEEKYIPNSDYIFATSCETAEYVNGYELKKGKKFYFIQSYETWSMKEERLIKTWKYAMKKIVISRFLKKRAEQLKEEALYIENGLDFQKFYHDDIILKDPQTLMMLYHVDENVKQSKKCIKILTELKKEREDIKIILFGTSSKPKDIPEWVEYYKTPSINKLRELYNRATIFISPSKIEGWALPPAEAMQCKTCVCVTDIVGHEYVKHLETGYRISNDLSDLKNGLNYLLDNFNVRKELANSGHNFIKSFTWEKAYSKLKFLLEQDSKKK